MQRPTMSREQMRQGLGNKTKEAYDRKDGNSLFKTYLNEGLISEQKISKFNPGKGEWIIDIIPYIAGKNDPLNQEGESVYVLDILVHMDVGPAGEKIVCLSQFNLPCPVCELIKKKQSEGEDYKTCIKPLQAKRRTLYNVIVRENPEEEKKGVQLLEISHFFLQKNIAALSKNPRKGGYIIFSDLDDGRSIGFRRTGVGAENTAYDAHQFIDRPAPITDAEWQAAKCLDDFIVIRAYKDIYDMLHAAPATPPEDGATAGTPASTGRKLSMTPPPEETDDNQQETAEDNQQEEEQAEQAQQTTPPKASGTKKRPLANATVCPVEDGIFGVSFDEFVECDTCALRDTCAAAAASA